MQIRRSVIDSPMVRWSLFSFLLILTLVWSGRDVLLRARQMKAADTSSSAFFAMRAGTRTKAVVLLDDVAGKELRGKLLERNADTVYRKASASAPAIDAVLTPETSVVMGKPEDIASGAIVQISGIVDENHALQAREIVILTGYVHLAESAR